MRKIAYLLVLLVFVANVTVAEAVIVDKTASVTASGALAGATSLSADVASINYGTNTTDRFATAPKIKLTYNSNYNPWKILISTNNTQIPLKAVQYGMYAKGGLVSGTTPGPYNTTACKWITKIGTTTTTPALPTATTYNFVKDIRDEDDLSTTGQNESWATALAGGYPVIAWGDASGNGYCVDPTVSGTYQGDAITPTSGVAVYVAAGYASNFLSPAVKSAAGSYTTTFVFELIHE